jgi:hypothetical protein
MRARAAICLDLLKAFIHPIDAIPAINHNYVNILTRLKGMIYRDSVVDG